LENYITKFYDRANRPENVKVETEEEVDEDEEGPYVLHSKMEKVIKEMKSKTTAVDDDVPGEVLKLLGEDGCRIVTQLINNIYENRVTQGLH
jgi:hypothetical protein